MHSQNLTPEQRKVITSANNRRYWTFFGVNTAVAVGLFLATRSFAAKRPAIANTIIAAGLFTSLLVVDRLTNRSLWNAVKEPVCAVTNYCEPEDQPK